MYGGADWLKLICQSEAGGERSVVLRDEFFGSLRIYLTVIHTSPAIAYCDHDGLAKRVSYVISRDYVGYRSVTYTVSFTGEFLSICLLFDDVRLHCILTLPLHQNLAIACFTHCQEFLLLFFSCLLSLSTRLLLKKLFMCFEETERQYKKKKTKKKNSHNKIIYL